MAKLDRIAAKAEAFSESATALAAKASTTLDKIENIQHVWTVIDSGEGKLSPDSYSNPPGTAERKLLDAAELRRASADLLSQYGQMLAAMGKGDPEEVVEKQTVLFDAATERLEALHAAADAATAVAEAADADMAADEKGSEPAPHSAEVEKLEGAAGQTLGILGFVAKVARGSTPGRVSGIIVIVSQRIAWRQRMLKGSKIIAKLVPKSQDDVEKLSGVIVDSMAPLDSATDKLIGAILDWHNAHRPGHVDPARFSYEMRLASLLQDGRDVKASLAELADSYGKLAPAHKELAELVMTGSDGKASDHLVKAVAKGRHRFL